MSPAYPLQKICMICPGSSTQHLLLVASGPELCMLSLSTGKILSQWPPLKEVYVDLPNEDPNVPANGERPAKRQRTDPDSSACLSRRPSDTSEVSVEIVAERKKGERRRPKLVNHKLPNISHLLATKDGHHAIAVTADDKTITVFRLTQSSQLEALSQRALPKRLCAVKLTADESTILAADKFGDVYAIPLIQSEEWSARPSPGTKQAQFTPSATELTVHTKGNLAALRQQREQKHFKQRKEGPSFEHKLLLGHVSLLTDIVVAEGTVDGRQRSFILTADRDEHIRVSRGIPQAHIIERYCLGHKEFVSKLCIVPWCPDILIAGNGKPSLTTYRWQTGVRIQDFLISDLAEQLQDMLKGADDRGTDRLVVSGIWPVQTGTTPPEAARNASGVLLVALEGTPLLLTFELDEDDHLACIGFQKLKGNILDVVQVGKAAEIVVSLDLLHEPYSVQTYRSGDFASEDCLCRLRLVQNNVGRTEQQPVQPLLWEELELDNENLVECLCPIADTAGVPSNKSKDNERVYSEVGEFLYGLENLRKKRETAPDEEVMEMEEPAVSL